MTRIDVTDTLEYKTKLPTQGMSESDLDYLRRTYKISSVMDILKDMTNVMFLQVVNSEMGNNETNERAKLLYEMYCRLLKDQERLLKKAGEWNV